MTLSEVIKHVEDDCQADVDFAMSIAWRNPKNDNQPEWIGDGPLSGIIHKVVDKHEAALIEAIRDELHERLTEKHSAV